jgi:hypothetical protein
MKNSLTYGFVLALAGALLAMLLFFLGFNDTAEKMQSAKWISMILGIVIAIVVIVIGVKDKRAQTPADRPWTYGSAFAAGFMIGLFGALFSAIFQYVFFTYIDPGIQDIIWQAQRAAFEAKGLTADKIDQIEPMVRKWSSPIAVSLFAFVGAVVFNTIISLVVGAFTKDRPGSEPPALA